MTSSADAAVFVIGTLALFALATVGAGVLGVLSFMGLSTLRHQLEKVEAADQLIELEMERRKLEDLAK